LGHIRRRSHGRRPFYSPRNFEAEGSSMSAPNAGDTIRSG
jgi:hypothetical protein